MKIELVVISGRSLDTEPSILIQTEQGSYLFNVPDLTQRLFLELKLKIIKVKQTFITSVTNECMGGLDAMTLTSCLSSEPEFGLTTIDPHTLNPNKPFYDECKSCYATPKAPSDVQNSDESNAESQEEKKLPFNSGPYKDEFISVNPFPLGETTGFDIQLPDIPGKFLPKKALSFGIKPGPLFKKLQNGETIVLDDGRQVTIADCAEPPTPGDRLLVINIKDLSSLSQLPPLSPFTFIVHFTQPSLLTTPEYLKAFEGLNIPQVCFMDSNNFTFMGATSVYDKIAKNAPFISPLCGGNTSTGSAPNNWINGVMGLTYTFAPVDRKKFVNNIKYPPEIQSLHELNNLESPLPVFSKFGVTFLGTGAAIPSRLRNVTGILLHTNDGFIAIDPGEGYIFQIRRKFGLKNAKYILENLKGVWISHVHGDHMFGLLRLLSERAKVSEQTIVVAADDPIIQMTQTYEKIEGENSFKCTYVNHAEIVDLGFAVIKSTPVDHCEGSRGCIIKGNGFSIGFSGDRSTNDGFNEFVAQEGGCDLLIHECTYDNEMEEQASQNKHTTTQKALLAAEESNAKFEILTHLSTRYSNGIPKIEKDNVCFAFDYLSFGFDDIAKVIKLGQESVQFFDKNE